jgi:hypothetical protein
LGKLADFVKLHLSKNNCVPIMNIPLKKKIQHWFNFLKLAHASTDPVVVQNLKDSRSFYEAWGNYQDQSFTKWWKDHRQLFRTVSSLRRMSAQDVVDDTALFLVIPFTYAPTSVAKIVQRIYAEEQDARSNRKTKVKKVYGGSYGLSTDEFQVSQFAYYFRYAKEVYLPLMNSGNKVRTKHFIELAQKSFARQKLVTSLEDAKLARRKVPFKDSSDEYANLSKRARDFNRIVHNLLVNVSKGAFPGDYLTASVKNQSALRSVKRAAPVRSHRRGVSDRKYLTKKSRIEQFDPYRSVIKN